MATRQYIGARYVIKIYENSQTAGSAEWEANTSYEPLTMVTYQNSSYLSKKAVPANIGNPASNTEYWVVTGAYNGQIANLQQQINSIVYHNVDTSNTNITTALQSAVDTCPVGEYVVIPNGTYEISDYITITRNINILCLGTLKPVGTLNNVSKGILYFKNVSNIDVVVKCVNTSYASTCNVIMLENCSNVHIHDSYINIKQTSYDGTAGVNLGENTHDVTIDNCCICAQYGILANDVEGVHDIIIENNTFIAQSALSGKQGDAIEFNTPTYGSSHIRISNNYASNYIWDTNNSRFLVFGFAHVSHVIIEGNEVYNCDAEAIHLENGCSDFIINGNILNKVFVGITVISNSSTRINSDITITNNNISTEGMLGSHNMDSGFAIDITTGTDGNWNARIKIANNSCFGGTDSSNGICVYNGLDVQIENNLIRKFVRSGLDICVYSDSVGMGLENIRCTNNEVSLCGWNSRLGYRSWNATPKAIHNFTFKDNLLNGSTYGINVMSCVAPTGTHDVEYFAQSGNSNYYSEGDIIVTELSGAVSAGTVTHKYCTTPGTPSSATLVDLY